jgi:hypothetical protein
VLDLPDLHLRHRHPEFLRLAFARVPLCGYRSLEYLTKRSAEEGADALTSPLALAD